MTLVFAVIVVLHALIHLMGFAKAFGYADLPQLTQPVSQAMGLLWLLAAILLLTAAAVLWAWPRWWWVVGAGALVVSQVVIATAWADAKFGTFANVVLLVGVVFGVLTYGPGSLHAQYISDVDRGLARRTLVPAVTEADLAHLPAPAARYLRASGVIGQPRVVNMRARMHGRIRGGPDEGWMPFTAEQHNFYDRPSRFFYMNASRMLVPIQGLHRFVDREAMMLVKLAALLPVARSAGPEMTQAETVTLFNDMCVMAPSTLIDPTIQWTAIDDRTVRARFTAAGHTIEADLFFNAADELVDFRSHDRRQSANGGTTLRQVPWTTPMRAYRSFGAFRLASEGAARWHEASGDYAYIEMTIDDVETNVSK
jgi:hypothetical protein